MRRVLPITINLYAEDEQEAQLAQKALGQFVNDLGHLGIAVTGQKVADIVPRWSTNPIVRQRIINHFKQ